MRVSGQNAADVNKSMQTESTTEQEVSEVQHNTLRACTYSRYASTP